MDNNMTLEQFIDALKNNVLVRAENEGIAIKLDSSEYRKVNALTTKLTAQFDGSNVGPSIDVNEYYKAYVDGDSFDNIADNFYSTMIQAHKNLPNFDVSVLNRKFIEDNLHFQIMNYAENEELASSTACVKLNDLVLVPYVSAYSDANSVGAFRLTKDMQTSSMCQMTDQEVHIACYKNLANENFRIEGMNEVITRMIKPNELPDELLQEMLPQDEMMYVVTNNKNIGAAVALASPDAIKQIQTKIGEDKFFAIPSSRHELIIIGESKCDDPADLHSICMSINADEDLMNQKDVLSDNIYFYNGEKMQICNSIGELQEQLNNTTENLTENFNLTKGVK